MRLCGAFLLGEWANPSALRQCGLRESVFALIGHPVPILKYTAYVRENEPKCYTNRMESFVDAAFMAFCG